MSFPGHEGAKKRLIGANLDLIFIPFQVFSIVSAIPL